MTDKTPMSMDKDDPTVYARPRWRHATRVFGALVVVFMNIAAFMSTLTRWQAGGLLSFEKELVMVSVVIVCDLMILLPTLLEVDMAKITDDKLILKLTFWKIALPWAKITSFKRPSMFVFAVVRTGRCFYLINRRQISRFDQLAENIAARTSLPQKT